MGKGLADFHNYARQWPFSHSTGPRFCQNLRDQIFLTRKDQAWGSSTRMHYKSWSCPRHVQPKARVWPVEMGSMEFHQAWGGTGCTTIDSSWWAKRPGGATLLGRFGSQLLQQIVQWWFGHSYTLWPPVHIPSKWWRSGQEIQNGGCLAVWLISDLSGHLDRPVLSTVGKIFLMPTLLHLVPCGKLDLVWCHQLGFPTKLVCRWQAVQASTCEHCNHCEDTLQILLGQGHNPSSPYLSIVQPPASTLLLTWTAWVTLQCEHWAQQPTCLPAWKKKRQSPKLW